MSIETETLVLEFDGGSRGNPGPAGIGVVLRAADGTPLLTLGRFIGRATNNIAEYRALVTGLERALELGARRLAVRGDSELIIRQMRGEYRVRNADLREWYDQARQLLARFEQVSFTHNYRSENALADKLANLAMDLKSDVTEADEAGGGAAPNPPAPRQMRGGDRWDCARCGCVVQVLTVSRLRPHQLRPPVCACGAKMNL